LKHELPLSLICKELEGSGGRAYFFLGTAMVVQGESVPSRGRILILSEVAQSGKNPASHISLVSECWIKGAANAMAIVHGKLVVTVGSWVELYALQALATPASPPTLKLLHRSPSVFVTALHLTVREDLILAGDLMKSFHLFRLADGGSELQTLARHTDPHYPTAMEIIDDRHFLGANTSEFLYSAAWDAPRDGPMPPAGHRSLQETGTFRLGDTVNRFRPGTLINAHGLQCRPLLLFATVHGAVGAVSALKEGVFATLVALQTGLQAVLPALGGLRHEA
jgi:hypothetical protein